MKISLAAFGSLALGVSLTGAVPASSDDSSSSTHHPSTKCPIYGSKISPRDSFAGYMDALYNRHEPEQIRPFWNPEYLLHRPFAPLTVDLDVGIQSLEQLDLGSAVIGWQLIVPPCDGSDLAITFSRYVPATGPALANVDVYRFQGPCIAEYSRVQEVIPANATNPLPFFFEQKLPTKAVVPKCPHGH